MTPSTMGAPAHISGWARIPSTDDSKQGKGGCLVEGTASHAGASTGASPGHEGIGGVPNSTKDCQRCGSGGYPAS